VVAFKILMETNWGLWLGEKIGAGVEVGLHESEKF
jgi:hypothetical protein